jgi:hypothetical protein
VFKEWIFIKGKPGIDQAIGGGYQVISWDVRLIFEKKGIYYVLLVIILVILARKRII